MLSPQHVEHYHREGYVVYPGFLSRDELATFHAEMERVAAGSTLAHHDKTRLEMEPKQAPDGTLVRRLYEPCTHYELFREFSESDKLLDCVEQLLGPDLLFHYSKINMKPAGIGSPVEWHQDLSYYPLTNRDSVSILFYLDDATVQNGCLQVIPRRHDGPLLSHSTDGFFQGKVTEPVDGTQAVPLEGKAGAVIFMSCMTPHASITNTSTHPRRTLILSYRAADACPIYCGEMTHLTEQNVRLVRGQRALVARFTMTDFPIPRYEKRIASLYELQEQSRSASAKPSLATARAS
ncbi:MAG: phytanoyl-CoA dioxygenase family protein [Candidatus Latescibacteria bacterium]|nr:phytanoyl-CoA dioxygenase family protein [Candidatus Latescibacterota bacterium]